MMAVSPGIGHCGRMIDSGIDIIIKKNFGSLNPIIRIPFTGSEIKNTRRPQGADR